MEEQRKAPAHDTGTRRGEELAGGSEPGREETGTTGTGRPTGKSRPRDFNCASDRTAGSGSRTLYPA